MKLNIFKLHTLLFVAPLLWGACSEDAWVNNAPVRDGEPVNVTIDVTAEHLSVALGATTRTQQTIATGDIVCEMQQVAPATRATGIDDPADATQTTIKNLWVLQYDGTGDDAKLIGTPVYIEDYTDPANRTAKLVASTTDNTIIFLANTFDHTLPFQQNSTIKELKDRHFNTQTLGTILSKDPNTAVAGNVFPNDGDYYQRLNGQQVSTITEGSTLTCALQHNLCRISLNVTNNTAGTAYPVTLTSADVENVPGCVYFFSDYPEFTSGTAAGKPTLNDQNYYGLLTHQYVATWTGAECTSGTKSAKIYLPSNESGVIANTNPKLKSLFAPSRATILRIHGTYKEGSEDIPLTYTFALGEDMTSNYQLVPNGDYIYNITLNARGDKTTDARVTYGRTDGIDYTTTAWPLSNCYICNPSNISTSTATYKIPVARVDQFWGGGNYENVPNNCLKTTNAWEVSVIWSDMPVNAQNFVISKSTGTGKDDYFEVSVPGTSVMGNVLIGIKRTGEGAPTDWLWSWHMWVTDYCPDDATYLVQQGAFIDGTDTYQVKGGSVQRYTAPAAGDLQKVYMDRNVGVLSPTDVGFSVRGALYYQFGRKDPFPGDSPEYYEGGTTKKTYALATKAYNLTDVDTQPCNVPYSVKNPTVFITSDASHAWTLSDKYNPSTIYVNSPIIWQDPYASTNGNKSIFDPSPSGWKVPITYSGLFLNNYAEGITFARTSFVSSAGNVVLSGRGYRQGHNGSCSGYSAGYLWASIPASTANAMCLYSASNTVQFNSTLNVNCPWRSFGKPVRPIQE